MNDLHPRVVEFLKSTACPYDHPEAVATWTNERDALIEDVIATNGEASFQTRVTHWMMECFGREISDDRQERAQRFLEEALELVQAGGLPVDHANRLVAYVYGRPTGEFGQEVGGVMVTLAAFCRTYNVDVRVQGERELRRIWGKIDVIREKQARKPKFQPEPIPTISGSHA